MKDAIEAGVYAVGASARTLSRTASCGVWCVGLFTIAACHEKAAPDPTPASATVVTPAAPTPSATSEPRPSETWRGAYEAKPLRLTVEPEAANEKAWKQETATHSGKGTIELSIDASGKASGTAEGSLGKAVINGQLEDELLLLTITPEDSADPLAFSGTASLKKVDSSKLEGTLKVSTGDSLTLRHAVVSLTRMN